MEAAGGVSDSPAVPSETRDRGCQANFTLSKWDFVKDNEDLGWLSAEKVVAMTPYLPLFVPTCHGQTCTQARADVTRQKGEEGRALKQLVVLGSFPVVPHLRHLPHDISLACDGAGHDWSYFPGHCTQALKHQRQVVSLLQCTHPKPASSRKGRVVLYTPLTLQQRGPMSSFKHVLVQYCQAKACLVFEWPKRKTTVNKANLHYKLVKSQKDNEYKRPEVADALPPAAGCPLIGWQDQLPLPVYLEVHQNRKLLPMRYMEATIFDTFFPHATPAVNMENQNKMPSSEEECTYEDNTEKPQRDSRARPREPEELNNRPVNWTLYFEGWRLSHFPGQPVPMLDNPFSEEKFPNIQSKPPLAQLEAISSRPITCYLGEETDPHLSTTSLQVILAITKSNPRAVSRDIFNLIRLLRAPSNLTLNVSRDGASTTSLANLLQCFTTLIVKTFFLISSLNLPSFSSKPLPLVLLQQALLKILKGPNKVSPEPSLLQAEQPQLSQPFFIGEMFHPLDHLCGPPLDPIQQVCVFPVLRAPELDAVLQVGSHQHGVEGQNHLPQPAGHNSFDTDQDMVGFLGCECTFLAHVQLFIHQYPQVLLHRAALNHIIPQPVLILGVAHTQVQDLALGLDEPHEVHIGPLLQLVQVPLDGILSLRRVDRTTQLGVIFTLAEGALDPTAYVIDEDTKQYWSQYGPLRDTTCH
ncbi:hypothetical protein QYF61_003851 [Mycteria americana]|uniref:Uncharacterized protein n=1 Tax=Mycteria americana TaxID=33587 RepID=A0AAN7P3R9_MYCAM|nr:hypothetical protein QYF61_003851 [Mycteria americana]